VSARATCPAYASISGPNRSTVLLMIRITTRDEIVAPVIMSISCGSPVA
jgi:hypothetical protein